MSRRIPERELLRRIAGEDPDTLEVKYVNSEIGRE